MKVSARQWNASDWQGINDVIADKGYGYYDIRALIASGQKVAVIPRRKGVINPGVRDKQRYDTRPRIERVFLARSKIISVWLFATASWT